MRAYDLSYWDEVLAFEKRISGPYHPFITNHLFAKFVALSRTLPENRRPARAMAEKWRDLHREMERHFMITHGREHWDYNEVMKSAQRVNGFLAMWGVSQ